MIVLADEPAAGLGHLDQAVTPVPNVSPAAGRTTVTTAPGRIRNLGGWYAGLDLHQDGRR